MAAFDPNEFPCPLYLLVSCVEKTQPEEFSLLSPNVRLPARRGPKESIAPIFTSRYQASRFAKAHNVPDGIRVEVRTIADIINYLYQMVGLSCTHVSFDPTAEADPDSVFPIQEVIDAIKG